MSAHLQMASLSPSIDDSDPGSWSPPARHTGPGAEGHCLCGRVCLQTWSPPAARHTGPETGDPAPVAECALRDPVSIARAQGGMTLPLAECALSEPACLTSPLFQA